MATLPLFPQLDFDIEPIPFPPELRTAAIVPRWSVIHTLNRDTVATHSFFVAMYAYQIARLISWRGPTDRLLIYALSHDLEETITGDIPGPVKHNILWAAQPGIWILNRLEKIMPVLFSPAYSWLSDLSEEFVLDIRKIVKTADRLDAVLFVETEIRMGNSHIKHKSAGYINKLYRAWMELPISYSDSPYEFLEEVWEGLILPAIDEHRKSGSAGLDDLE